MQLVAFAVMIFLFVLLLSMEYNLTTGKFDAVCVHKSIHFLQFVTWP